MCKPGHTQADFINGVFEVETDLGPDALLGRLEEVEKSLGRLTKGDWAPRSIDLDLLFYDNLILETPRLRLPHPEIQNRWFVLKPLADLAPDMVHPVLQKTVKELLGRVRD